jgi:Na+/H+ antiporter NhaD/arsenite permease-like protein
MVKANDILSAVIFKVLPFFFGLFEILLSLYYAGIIG